MKKTVNLNRSNFIGRYFLNQKAKKRLLTIVSPLVKLNTL